MNERVLRACLRAYPASVREREGEVLLGLACDLADSSSSTTREAAALLIGGVRTRLEIAARDVVGAPWREARRALAPPLASVLLVLMIVGAARGWQRWHGSWIGWTWTLSVIAATIAAAGAWTGRRAVATTGAVAVLAMCLLDAARDLYGPGSRWVEPIVDGGRVDVLALAIPVAALLVAGAAAPAPSPDGRSTPTRAVGVVRTSVALLLLAGALPALWVVAGALGEPPIPPVLFMSIGVATALVAVSAVVRIRPS